MNMPAVTLNGPKATHDAGPLKKTVVRRAAAPVMAAIVAASPTVAPVTGPVATKAVAPSGTLRPNPMRGAARACCARPTYGCRRQGLSTWARWRSPNGACRRDQI